MREIPEEKPPKPNDGREYLWDVDKARWEAIEDNNAVAEEEEEEVKDWTENFFPKPPPYRAKSSLTRMALPKKKRRFLHAFDAYCGVLSMALKCSGLTREQYEQFSKEDEEFKRALAEIKLLVADRAKYNLFEAIGLIKPRPGKSKVSENTLLQTNKALNKELFNDEGEGSVTVNLTIPRPERPADKP